MTTETNTIDIEAEGNLLSAMVTRAACIDSVGRIVAASDFADDRFGRLFEAICILHQAKKVVEDLQVLHRGLGDLGLKWTVGDLGYLINNHFTSDPEYHANLIARLARLRRLQTVFGNAIARCEERGADPEAIARDVDAHLMAIDCVAAAVESAPLIGKRVLDSINDPARHRGFMLGLPILDQSMGVICPGEMIVLAARPGVGKTAMAMQFAHAIAMKGRRVLYVSLEMSADELIARTGCGEAGVNLRHLRAETLDASDRDVLAEAMAELPETLMIHAPSAATMADIRGVARLEGRFGLDMIVIDYLQLIDGERSDRTAKRYEQITQISREIKQLAKSQNVPVLALSQLSRAGDGRPELIHLRESGAIEQDADIVLLLSRDEAEATLNVAKHRAGETGAIKLIWNGAETRFSDDAYEYQEFRG